MDNASVSHHTLDLRPALIAALLGHAFLLLAFRSLWWSEFVFDSPSGGAETRNAVVWIDAASSASAVSAQFSSSAFAESAGAVRDLQRKKFPVPRAVQKRGASSASPSDASNAHSSEALGSGGAAAASGNASSSTILSTIAAQLRRARYYPEAAQARQWQGRPIVTFRIMLNGNPTDLRIATTSGIPVLDAAALETVRRAAPLPYFPAAITLPINYALH